MSGNGFRMGFAGRAVLAGGMLGMGVMAGPAQATLYNWTWQDDDGWSSSGQFDETGGTITSFSGDWNGIAIDSLSSPGAFPIDGAGVSFLLTSPLGDGSTIVNLSYTGDPQFGPYAWFGNQFDASGYGTFTATAVPEPASVALLGTAVAGLLAGARRRRVKAAAAA